MSGEFTRRQYSLRGVTVTMQYLGRGHPIPGLDVELDTPWGTIGGYLHA